MERQTRQSVDTPKWAALLVEAVNKPSLIMKAIARFIRIVWEINLLALVQCQMRGCSPAQSIRFRNGKTLDDT